MARSNEMDKLSFTAHWMVAQRTLTSIPYSKEINEILLEKAKRSTKTNIHLQDALGADQDFSNNPMFEGRYRLSDRLMKENGATKVLELASGLAPRGLHWTQNPDYVYVEFDLPRQIEEKRQIVEELLSRSKITRPNLYFEAGDALSQEDMIAAVSHLHKSGGPIVIVNEGLLNYLTHDQKKIVAENVKYLLDQFGGCWITPDVNPPNVKFADGPFSQLNRTARMEFFASKGVQVHQFESLDFAKNFFEELGFSVEQRSFREVIPEMACQSRFNLSEDTVDQWIGSKASFVMRCKSTWCS